MKQKYETYETPMQAGRFPRNTPTFFTAIGTCHRHYIAASLHFFHLQTLNQNLEKEAEGYLSSNIRIAAEWKYKAKPTIKFTHPLCRSWGCAVQV